MSNENNDLVSQEVPLPSQEEGKDALTVTSGGEVVKDTKKTSPTMWMSARDTQAIVEILSKADGIPPEQVVQKINQMCNKGVLCIVPWLGVVR